MNNIEIKFDGAKKLQLLVLRKSLIGVKLPLIKLIIVWKNRL